MKQSRRTRSVWSAGSERTRRIVMSTVLLVVAVTYWHVQLRGPSLKSMGLPEVSASVLPAYQASVQGVAVAGIADNLSGLAYNEQTNTLFSVINNPPAVAELSTSGELLRLMPLSGVEDTEGIAHIKDYWFAIADERSNRLHWVEIRPGQQAIAVAPGQSLDLGAPIFKNFAVEGLGWDSQRQQLLAVMEKWPLRVLRINGAGIGATAQPADVEVTTWHSDHPAGVPSTDLSAIEVDPRSGSWLLLSEESSTIYEYTPAGALLGVMPLWKDMHGLRATIPQPEGMAMSAAGTLYVVSEPNLFYRFD